jgi:thymidylate synthase
MYLIQARNVHEALPRCLKMLRTEGIDRESRNGPVRMFPMPVTTMYEAPEERVIFWAERDANPFFHFYESLWMLAGRNDVAPLTKYVPRMKDFSDDGEVFHGAYGYRWRKHFEFDQLPLIAAALKKNPDDRRQVLAMWDAGVDLAEQEGRKDLPCNTQAMFSVTPLGHLNMMVTNRSNDIVLGAYGANAVHFSFLQEYMAARVGVKVGTYWQVSNNFHVYKTELEKVEPIVGRQYDASNPYDSLLHVPIVNGTSMDEWDGQLDLFLAGNQSIAGMDAFFRKVADPIVRAHGIYKSSKDLNRFNSVFGELTKCKDAAWKRACIDWMTRRYNKEKAK